MKNKLINLDPLKAIIKGNNEALLGYIEMYLEHTPEEIDQIKKYFTEKNWKSLEIVAHNMKSKASYMGIPKLNELAEAIERYDYNDDSGYTGLNDLICKFDKLFELVQTELIKEKTRLAEK